MYRRYRRFNRTPIGQYNSFAPVQPVNPIPKPTTVGTLLFDPADASTLTEAKDKSTKWSVDTVRLSDESLFGIVTVYDNLGTPEKVLDESHNELAKHYQKIGGDFSVHSHCQFCGQKLVYVAVIVGIDRVNRETATVYQIGCDCVGKIFGESWYGYRTANDAKKTLVEAAKVRRRKEEYATKYAKELAWLNSLPDMLIVRKSFLVDIKKIITTGSREITEKMEKYLRVLMHDKELDAKNFAKASILINTQIEKVQSILKLVESQVDATELHAPWSSYDFVKSILDRLIQWRHPLSQAQMDGLNKVYVRYMKSILPESKLNPNMKGNPNDVPW